MEFEELKCTMVKRKTPEMTFQGLRPGFIKVGADVVTTVLEMSQEGRFWPFELHYVLPFDDDGDLITDWLDNGDEILLVDYLEDLRWPELDEQG